MAGRSSIVGLDMLEDEDDFWYDEATGHWRHLLINRVWRKLGEDIPRLAPRFQNPESRREDQRSIGGEVDDWTMLVLSHDTAFSSKQLDVNGTGSDRCG